jgi:tetratricopeptide (TPR) repeat protein
VGRARLPSRLILPYWRPDSVLSAGQARWCGGAPFNGRHNGGEARVKRRSRVLLGLLLLGVVVASGARADSAADCFSEDLDRRIEGCTALIDQGDQGAADLSYAYAMRALAYSLKGRYQTAIRDYDVAIAMKPDFAVALNNRAWALFRWGKAAEGLPDVERSLELSPTSAHSLDTRAHIKQALGDPKAALRDYDRAMWYGGARMIKLYQCGLTEQKLYSGEIDGTWRPEVTKALEQCVLDKACDPLPADEQCRAATS